MLLLLRAVAVVVGASAVEHAGLEEMADLGHADDGEGCADEESGDDDSTDDLLDSVRDAKFLADAEKEAEEERAGQAAFDAKMERRRVAAAAAAVEDDSDIS
jgi:hypothetical protein